jgi:ABC-type multidrug transport system fused ATPase/permease subunit
MAEPNIGTTSPGTGSRYALIWRLMEGQRLRYGMAIGALILGSCILYLVLLVPQVVLDGVLAADPTKASSFVAKVMDLAGGREFLRSHLWWAAVAILILTAISGLFAYLRGRWSTLASEAIARSLRLRLYDRLQHLPCAWHDQAATGEHACGDRDPGAPSRARPRRHPGQAISSIVRLISASVSSSYSASMKLSIFSRCEA